MEHKLTSFPKVSNSHFEKNDKPRIAAAGAIGVDLREQLMPMQQWPVANVANWEILLISENLESEDENARCWFGCLVYVLDDI